MTQRSAVRSASATNRSGDRAFWIGIARACGGAVFFSMPLLMTMEMWWLGFYMDRFRLALFLIWMIPILVVLDRYSGFEPTSSWSEDLVDGIIGYGIGFATSAVVLSVFNVINLTMPFQEILGKISVQAVPASFGAVLANSQLGGQGGNSGESHRSGAVGLVEEGDRMRMERKEQAGYLDELFFMLVGAVFLAFNVAPTEEMILIAFKMTMWHTLALAVISLLVMHAFVYAVEFRGAPSAPEGTPAWSLFLRFTVVGYVIALLVSAYVLWTFGRYEDSAWVGSLQMAVVLGFPASLGAAAGRLIL